MIAEKTPEYIFDGCKGCLANENKICRLYQEKKIEVIYCPCQNCIIKGMCQKSCDNLKNFVIYLHGKNERKIL